MGEADSKRRGQAVVTDIVHILLETRPVAAARRCGVTPVNGLGMLLHQAAPGFQHWFRWRPSLKERLRKRIFSDPERMR